MSRRRCPLRRPRSPARRGQPARRRCRWRALPRRQHTAAGGCGRPSCTAAPAVPPAASGRRLPIAWIVAAAVALVVLLALFFILRGGLAGTGGTATAVARSTPPARPPRWRWGWPGGNRASRDRGACHRCSRDRAAARTGRHAGVCRRLRRPQEERNGKSAQGTRFRAWHPLAGRLPSARAGAQRNPRRDLCAPGLPELQRPDRSE